jgi:hypothetical protein
MQSDVEVCTDSRLPKEEPSRKANRLKIVLVAIDAGKT